MEGLKKELEAIKALPQDDFLVVLESALKSLSKGRTFTLDTPAWYCVQDPGSTKFKQDEGIEAMHRVLEMVGQSGSNEEQMTTMLTSAGLQEDRVRLLISQRAHIEELTSIRKKIIAPSEDLEEIQWKLGVVAGSSQEGDAGRTFVQVNFISQPPGGTKRNAKVVEMSLEKFYDFLHQLEKCKTAIEHRHLL